MNAIAAMTAHLRGHDREVDSTLERAEHHLGIETSTLPRRTRIEQVLEAATGFDAMLVSLATEIEVLVSGGFLVKQGHDFFIGREVTDAFS